MKQPLDFYDEIPIEMRRYLSHNGWHFNKRACEFAVSLMKKKNEATDEKEIIEPLSKEDVDALITENGIKLKKNVGYDYVYVANMCKADFLKSSVPDALHHAKYVKDVIDDDDGADGMLMREWYAKMTAKGVRVPWEEIL